MSSPDEIGIIKFSVFFFRFGSDTLSLSRCFWVFSKQCHSTNVIHFMNPGQKMLFSLWLCIWMRLILSVGFFGDHSKSCRLLSHVHRIVKSLVYEEKFVVRMSIRSHWTNHPIETEFSYYYKSNDIRNNIEFRKHSHFHMRKLLQQWKTSEFRTTDNFREFYYLFYVWQVWIRHLSERRLFSKPTIPGILDQLTARA